MPGHGAPVSRRRFVQTVGVGTAATAVAGCLGDGDGDDVLRIGHIMPAEIDHGIASERGAELTVDRINEDGGILDGDVELVTGDTAGSPSEAESVVEDMIHGDNVSLIIGTIVSEVALGIAETIAQNDVPFFVTGAATPRLFTDNHAQDYELYKNIFRPAPTNSVFQAESLGEYGAHLADHHDWDSIAVVNEDAAWTAEITELTTQQLEDGGVNVPINERVALDTNDWTPILDGVEDSGASAMLGGLSHIPVTGLLSSWRRGEYPFAVEGTIIAAQSPEFWEDTDGSCEYMTTATVAADGFAPISDATEDMVEWYTDEYDSRPSRPLFTSFTAHDAIQIYREAVERAGTFDHTSDLDAIVEELLETDYLGSSGRIGFFGPDEEYPHDVMPGETNDDRLPYTVVQWREAEEGEGISGTDGTKECVWPPEYATADHVTPEWM